MLGGYHKKGWVFGFWVGCLIEIQWVRLDTMHQSIIMHQMTPLNIMFILKFVG
jgi:hypothetical protein